ncbi:MAG: hypothetical protein KAR47_05890, partial [Planctomycetes bacterium]|nr:hypothetical protein [Planctomycetota bacterium]
MRVDVAFIARVSGNGLLLFVPPEKVSEIVWRVVLVQVAEPFVESMVVGQARGAGLAQAPLACDARAIA